jgi:formylglycine-generating enzyme required for sulfatase activity
MHGNAWEWCLDHWHANYQDAPFCGSAWLKKDANKSAETRLLRGGSWFIFPGDCRSAFRFRVWPGHADFSGVGLRVVCLPQGPSLDP